MAEAAAAAAAEAEESWEDMDEEQIRVPGEEEPPPEPQPEEKEEEMPQVPPLALVRLKTTRINKPLTCQVCHCNYLLTRLAYAAISSIEIMGRVT